MGKTIQVAADRAYDKSSTVLPRELARGIYMRNPPSLQALKLMHLMIGAAGGRMAEDARHEIRLADIRKIEGMKNHTRQTVASLFEELRATVLSYDDRQQERHVIGGLLDEAVLDYRHEISGDVVVAWYFGRTFRRMAEESNHWAIIDRQTVFHLGSKYAVLLFQHIASYAQYDHVRSLTFTIPELRGFLGIEDGKMPRFSSLNQRVLKPAIDDINQLSRFSVVATIRKIGRTVASVEISWENKSDDEKTSTRKELQRHSAGRKARREGTTEAVADEAMMFPKTGGIDFQPAWIALKQAAGCNMDNVLIAEQFRTFCAGRNINLAAGNITEIFSNFCRKVGQV